ncbi:elongator complex protein 4-like isoform X2 [Montipora foliosa]|uniref:elongator complex protein 4-like isoform X2 n=1 Tax=Montipora foliosa TaxID=591990 RepID=UPI0035F20956
MATSFRKKGIRSRTIYPPGTRPSLHNNQLLISSGVPSMDNMIGGGIAVGTIFMEDTFGSYARQLSKYFLAEGIVSGHAIFLASSEPDPSSILKDLPKDIDDKEIKTSGAHVQETEQKVSSTDSSMRIAWRYQTQPKFESTLSYAKFGHYFDLTKVMDEERVYSVPVRTFSVTNEAADLLECPVKRQEVSLQEYHEYRSNYEPATVYETLISRITSTVKDGGFSTSEKGLENRTILRIVLHGLGSPLWGEENSTPSAINTTLTRFLFQLRALMRSAFAVCLITAPTHLFQESALIRRMQRLCDTVVKLESFVGSDNETNPVYQDYHGLFHIIRLPRLNSLVGHSPESFDLAFKLRRKKMTIEKLHLPPDLAETANRTQEDSIRGKPGALSCQSSNLRLDF